MIVLFRQPIPGPPYVAAAGDPVPAAASRCTVRQDPRFTKGAATPGFAGLESQ